MQAPLVKDGVQRLSPTGISILIVGAGVGGLTVALEGWRQGHDVRLLERAQSLETLGDTFGIVPSALVTLRYFPKLRQEFEATGFDTGLGFYAHSGRQVLPPGLAAWNRPGASHAADGVRTPWIRKRAEFVAMLEAQVRRLGVPVEYGAQVVSYDEDEAQASVKTADGNIYCADVVIAADGIGSKSHFHITGSMEPAYSSGYAVSRGMIPRDCLEDLGTEAKEKYCPLDPSFRVYLAPGMHMNWVVMPRFVNYVLTHKDNEASEESWRKKIPASQVLQVMDAVTGWDPLLREVISKTPEDGVIDWKLKWRNPRSQWCSDGGRVLQVGDSAHSFTPTSGNGATQAMEDGLSLATCLRAGGRVNIKDSVRAHVVLRFERVSTLQHFGFAVREMFHKLDPCEMEKSPEKYDVKMSRWIWQHDPVRYAQDNYQGAVEAVRTNSPFSNTNLPLGHEYIPWTLEQETEREKQGLRCQLFDRGNWD